MDIKDYNFIETYENAIDSSLSDEIIKYFEDNKESSSDRPESFIKMGVEDKRLPLYYNAKDSIQSKFIKEIDSSVRKCFDLYKEKYKECWWAFTGLQRFSIKTFQIQKSEPGKGYNQWHSEKIYMLHSDNGMDGYQRFLVYTLYLNDIEEGGETEFYYQNVKIKPKKGMISLFPADFMFVHKGNPPKKIYKYLVTGWLHENVH